MSTSTTQTLRKIGRTPLVQATGLLWLVGAWKLVEQVPHGVNELDWPVGAAFAGATALLLLAYHRLLFLSAVPMVLGLIATMALTAQIGTGSATVLATSAALYALLSWQAVGALRHPLVQGAAGLLGVAGGHGPRGGRALLEDSAHWCGFATCVLTVLGLTAVAVVIGEQPWSALFVAGLFFALTGWRYGQQVHSYAVLTCALLGAWGLSANIGAPGVPVGRFLISPAIMLGTVALSIAFSLIAIVLERMVAAARVGDEEREPSRLVLAHDLYQAPLRGYALVLAVGAIIHQAMLTGFTALPGHDAPGAVVGLLAAGALLLADSARARPLWSFLGTLVGWVAVYQIALELLLPDWRALTYDHGARHALVLSAIAFALAGAGRLTGRRSGTTARYSGVLHANGGIVFAAAALVTGGMLVGLEASDATLSTAAALLIAGAIPVLAPCTPAAHWRGLALPILLTALAASLMVAPTMSLAAAGQAALVWGFVLWAVGAFVAGPWSRRFPGWAVSELTWPWYGLAFVLAGCAWLATSSPWTALACVALYLFLMLRSSGWVGFSWLATAALTAAGLGLCGFWAIPLTALGARPLGAGPVLTSIAWLNVLLAAVPLWQRHGQRVAERLGWQRAELALPLLASAAFVLLSALAGLGIMLATWAVVPLLDVDATLLALTALALTASFAHANRVAPGRVFAEALMVSLLALVTAVVMLLAGIQQLPVAIAFAGIAALVVSQRRREIDAGPFAAPIDAALRGWVAALPLAAAALALVIPPASFGAQLFVLAVVLGHAAALGWTEQRKRWLAGAALLAFALEHAVWLLWLPLSSLDQVLPWYALLGSVNVLAALWLIPKLERAESADSIRVGTLRAVLEWMLPVLFLITFGELLSHFVWVTGAVAAGMEPRWLSALDVPATLASWAVMVALAIRTAHRRVEARWIYLAAVLGGVAALYLRVVTIGLVPPGLVDTVALVGAAYVLFAVQRLTLSTPTLHVCLALPVLALATLPAQVGSAHGGAALMAIAVLYLLIRAQTRNRIPLYLGVLALNASVYLWVPLWADQLGMFQLYVMPAAISVLVLLQMHRRELRPSVLNGARLAALATLYSGAALDLFAHPSLGMFALALGLSLASVGVGIAFRIRAFLYGGIAFLILNVGYQLVQLYPEQRLGRAILLIVLGISITGAMIGFNMKREAILARIRIMRADLDNWE